MFFVGDMIRVIGAKNPMMHESMPLKWVAPPGCRAMHEKTMQCPLEEGTENSPADKAKRGPE